VVITYPEASVITDFQMSALDGANPPHEIFIYGRDSDISEWVQVLGSYPSSGWYRGTCS